MGKGAGIKPEDPGSVFRSPVGDSSELTPTGCPLTPRCVLCHLHTQPWHKISKWGIRFLELSEIYLFFTHLVPVDIWNTLLKIHSLFLKEKELSLPRELLIFICSSVLCPKVEGHGGDSSQRAHSLICPLWSSSSETQIQGAILLIWIVGCLSEPSWFNALPQRPCRIETGFLFLMRCDTCLHQSPAPHSPSQEIYHVIYNALSS